LEIWVRASSTGSDFACHEVPHPERDNAIRQRLIVLCMILLSPLDVRPPARLNREKNEIEKLMAGWCATASCSVLGCAADRPL